MYIRASSNAFRDLALYRSRQLWASVTTTDNRRGKLLPRGLWIALPFPLPFYLAISRQKLCQIYSWRPQSAVFAPPQLLTSGISIHGCETNFSFLPKDRRSSTELNTRYCAPLDLVVTLVSNEAQHLIESARRAVFLVLEGRLHCGGCGCTTCALCVSLFWT